MQIVEVCGEAMAQRKPMWTLERNTVQLQSPDQLVLHNEHSTTTDGLSRMENKSSTRWTRRKNEEDVGDRVGILNESES